MKRGAKHSPETKERIRQRLIELWKTPAFLGRSRGGRPKGSKQSPEAIEKIRLSMAARWRDPEYRARHLPILAAGQKKAASAAAAARFRPPARGTPERRLYNKISSILGAEAARSEVMKGAEP